MNRFLMVTRLKNECSNCDKRYSGCTADDESFDPMKSEGQACEQFVPGKCFYCALYQLNENSQCDRVLFPCGCDNFKVGNDYEQYVKLVNNEELNKDEYLDGKNHLTINAKQVEKLQLAKINKKDTECNIELQNKNNVEHTKECINAKKRKYRKLKPWQRYYIKTIRHIIEFSKTVIEGIKSWTKNR